MQPPSPNKESIEHDWEQSGFLKVPLLQVEQTGGKATAVKPGLFAGLPHRLTLPFITYSVSDTAIERQESSHGLLKRTRLISCSDVEREKEERLPVPASLPREYLAVVDTTSSNAFSAPLAERDERPECSSNGPDNFFSSLTEEQIARLDTAIMVTVRPRESGPGYTTLLVDTLIEDITQQATQSLPKVTQVTENTKQLERSKDITAIAGGAAIAGVGDLSYGLLRFVTNVAMTHMVSPAAYGIFGEVYTATLILGWVTKLGFDGVLVRLLPAYRVKDERGLAVGLVRFATWSTLLSGLLASALFFAFAAVIARFVYHDPSYRQPLLEVAPLIPLMAAQVVLACGLQAFKEIKWKVYMDRFSQPLITLIAMVVFYLLGWRMEALIFSAIGGFFCSVCIGYVALGKTVKRFTRDTPPMYSFGEWSRLAVPLLFNGLIQGILNSTDIVFLSIFAAPIQAGIYIAADRVSYFVVMPLFALNMIFSPLMGEYHASRKHEQLANMFKMVTKWSFSLSLPVFLCFVIFHHAILGIFGSKYTQGEVVLLILCFGNLVDAGTGSVVQLLAMTGHLRILLINSVISIIVNIGLSFFFVQYFGILGAALAAALAVIIINGLGLIEVYCIAKIHPYRRDIYKPLLAGGAAYLVAVLLLHFIHFDSGRFAGIEELSFIIPFMVVYVLVLVLLRFSEEDQIVFAAVRAKFGKQRSSNKLRTLPY